MRSRLFLAHEVRVSVGFATLLPLLGLPAFALLQWLFVVSDSSMVTHYELVRAFELILPLTGGLVAAHLMTVECEEGMTELRCAYPEPPWRLPASRTLVALALVTIAFLLGCATFRLVFGALVVGQFLKSALGPTLFLLGLSLLLGNMTQNRWTAVAFVMAYWFSELQTRGELTDTLFLFQTSWPVEGVPYALNRWGLAGLGMFFLLANLWVSARHKHGKGIRRRGD